MATGHRTAERRSIELHRLVAENLDADTVASASERVQSWLRDGGPVHADYARRWLDLLGLARDELASALTEDTAQMRDLRQNSPFAGMLSEEDRLAVIRDVH